MPRHYYVNLSRLLALHPIWDKHRYDTYRVSPYNISIDEMYPNYQPLLSEKIRVEDIFQSMHPMYLQYMTAWAM